MDKVISLKTEAQHKQKLEQILAKKKRQQKTKECLNYLYKYFPNTFFIHSPLKPLQIGLHKAILIHFKEKNNNFSNLIIRETIKKYTSRITYLKNLTARAVRIDLFGHEAGTVTSQQAIQAKIKLEYLQKKQRFFLLNKKKS